MGGLRFAALEDGLAPLDPFDSGGGAQEDLLGLEAAGAGVGDDAVRVGCPLAFGGKAKGEGIRGEVWGRVFLRTVAVGASRFRWGRWVGAAFRVGRARRARCGLRCGIGAGTSSRIRWTRLAGGVLGTGRCDVGCSGSLG